MGCISCMYAFENYVYSEEHECDIMYRTCEKRHDAPVGDDETCEYDTSIESANFIKPEKPFMLIFEDKEENLSVMWLKTEADLQKTVQEVKTGGCRIIKQMEIGSCREID